MHWLVIGLFGSTGGSKHNSIFISIHDKMAKRFKTTDFSGRHRHYIKPLPKKHRPLVAKRNCTGGLQVLYGWDMGSIMEGYEKHTGGVWESYRWVTGSGSSLVCYR